MLRRLLPILLIAAALPARGQHVVPEAFGLAQGVGGVYDLDPDADGTLWLGTSRGLVRFDGVRFQTTAMPDLDVPDVWAVAAEPGAPGVVWAWGSGRLYRREADGRARALPAPTALRAELESRIPAYVRLVALRGGGLLLLSHHTGLWTYDTGRWRHVLPVTGDDHLMDVAEAGDGTLWVLTRDRLGRLNPDQGAVRWVASVAEARHVRPHPDGLWIATDRGLFLRQSDGTMRTVLDERYRCWFTRPSVRSDGSLALVVEAPWAPGEAASVRLALIGADGTLRHAISDDAGLRTTALFETHYADDGSLWIASRLGLDRIEEPRRIAEVDLHTASGVHALRAGPDGSVWASTWGALVRVRGFEPERIGPAQGTGAVTIDPDGSVSWVAWNDRQGLFAQRWAGHRITTPAPRYAATLPNGQSLVARWTTGGRYDLLAASGEVLAPDVEGTVEAAGQAGRRAWVRLGGRLATLRAGVLVPGRQETSVPPSVRRVLARFEDEEVRGLATDHWGRPWIATRRGLARLDETGDDVWEVRFFDVADGLLDPSIHAMHLADGTRLWLATSRGVQGFWIGPPDETRPFRPIPLPGLAESLPAETVEAVAEAADGALWVAPHGPPRLFRFEWRGMLSLPPPGVRLSALTVNDRPVAVEGRIRLRADTSRFAIALAPARLSRTRGLRYSYRVPELDTGWTPLDGDPTIRFAYLAPGRYTVEARASRSGQPAGPTLTIPLVLTPPFWRAPWFLALGTLLLAGVVVVGVAHRDRAQARRARQLEAVVAQRTAELQAEKETTETQAERLRSLDAAKNRLFANVSHELRTPLTLLLGPVRDALAGRYGPLDGDAPLARQLPLMHRSGERLLGLVEQLLDLARLDADQLGLHVEPTDLGALARRTVAAFASHAEADGVALSCQAPADAEAVWVDPERAEQILTNLLSNALRFTPTGGRVRVEVQPEADAVVLVVRDSGEGIPADVLPHLFERFRQGERPPLRGHAGTGIGLALVRELAELHGGAVTAESTPGFGSTFTVRFPTGRDPLPPAFFEPRSGIPEPAIPAAWEAPPADPTPTASDAPLVLLVEDHDDLRAYLRDQLAPDYRIEEAADGAAGLDAARQLARSGDLPALVLSDLMMPGLDGIELCRALKADPALGHVPVVLLTARADEASRLEALGEGADDYLTKPFSGDELRARVENLIEVRRRLRARFSGEVVVRPAEVVVEAGEAEWLAEVTATVERHLTDPTLTVERLADELTLSARALQRRLKAASGLTPNAFVRTLRLERAAQLLEQGAGSIADVAHAVGFEDPSYFGRVFRQGFGMTPTEYAEQVGDGAGD